MFSLNNLARKELSYFPQLIKVDATGCCFPIEKRRNDQNFEDDIFKFTIVWKFFFIKNPLEFFPKIQLIMLQD